MRGYQQQSRASVPRRGLLCKVLCCVGASADCHGMTPNRNFRAAIAGDGRSVHLQRSGWNGQLAAVEGGCVQQQWRRRQQ